MKQIPTDTDWHSVHWCIDIPYAYEHFCGKTIPQATALFEDNSLYYQEDLLFMPAPCFLYYIEAYINYLLSDRSKGDCDGASCFFGLIESRYKEVSTVDRETVERIKAVLHRLGSQQSWYDADPDIYGDFGRKAEKLLPKLSCIC